MSHFQKIVVLLLAVGVSAVAYLAWDRYTEKKTANDFVQAMKSVEECETAQFRVRADKQLGTHAYDPGAEVRELTDVLREGCGPDAELSDYPDLFKDLP